MDLLRKIDRRKVNYGKIIRNGVGPGDPELLTLKAYKILNQADVIFCPEKKKGAGSFAFDIIKEHIKDSKAQIVNLEYPMHYKGDELKKNVGRKRTPDL